MSKMKSKFLGLVAIAVLCGLAAGIAGEIVTRVYFLKDFSVPYLNGDINIADFNAARPNLIIRDAKKVVVNQDAKVSETLSSVQTSLVKVFKEAAPAADSAETSSAYYDLEKPLLTGLIITSDGWVTAPSSNGASALTPTGYLAITQDRKVYKIDKVMAAAETTSGVTLFHLAGVTNLPIKRVVSRADLALGQSVLVVNNLHQVVSTSIASFEKMPAVLSSDNLSARLELAASLSETFRPAFVFNLAGDLLAIISSQAEVVPAFSYNNYWQSRLLPAAPGAPFLGVNYLDLTVVQPVGVNLSKGAWLYPAGKQAAVLKNSPAQVAGLVGGDVITWVNNQEINAVNDLADIIAKYHPGDKLTLTYWRNGVERDAEVTLGVLPNK